MGDITTSVADGIALNQSRNGYPAAVVCIALQLTLLGLGVGLGGMKFIERTWHLGGFCLALTTLSAVSHRQTIKDLERN